MSCVLRVTAPDIQSRLAAVRVKAFRVEGNTAHFISSDSSFDDFEGQVDEAFAFLVTHRTDIGVLLQGEEAEGCLDFAVETGMGFLFRRITAPLVREAAALNLSLEVSIYPSGDLDG
jgi:hypothetical protein